MIRKHPTPHDIFFQVMMEIIGVAESFFKNHLPPNVIEALDWTTLQLADSARRALGKKTTYTDITYVCYTKEGGIPVYLHVEQERDIDPEMIERVIGYKLALFTKCRKQKQKKLPIIFTFVLYNGNRRKKYPYHSDPFEYFSIPWMAKLAMGNFFGLINLNETSKEKLIHQGIGGFLELFLKSVDERNFVLWLEQRKEQIQELIAQGLLTEEVINMMIEYVMQAGKATPQEVLEAFSAIYPTSKYIIMTTAQQLEKRGIQQGIQRGMQQGIQRGIQQGMQQGIHIRNLAIAKNMLQAGLELSFIQKMTELNQAEIEKLKTQQSEK